MVFPLLSGTTQCFPVVVCASLANFRVPVTHLAKPTRGILLVTPHSGLLDHEAFYSWEDHGFFQVGL